MAEDKVEYYTSKVDRDENHYYLYRHIRLDTNEVFYIGIGVKPKKHDKTIENEYKRAYAKGSRNRFWDRVIKKSDYKVEIIYEHPSKAFIIEKEIEFVKLYGRRNLGLGTLTNLTDGGEGIPNSARSIVTKNKISAALRKRIRTKETFEKISKSKIKPILKLTLEGEVIEEYPSISKAAQEVGVNISCISVCLRNSNRTSKGFRWKYK